MSLLLNILSRLVITFLPRSKRLLISWLQSPSAVILEPRCENWIIKKAEHQRIDAFELWCGRRLLRVPWTVRSNQSILKEINLEYLLEGLMLKFQYFGHRMWRTDLLEKILILGKIEGKRRRGYQRMRWLGWHHRLDGHEFEQTLGDNEGQEGLVYTGSQPDTT